MRILITGSTGLVGTAVSRRLNSEGHELLRLVRPETRATSGGDAPGKTVRWDPATGEIDASQAEGTDALIHLAGASIADGRWNESRKNLLRTSRVDSTRHLIAALSRLKQPPRVIVSSSASGYYGDRRDESLTETSSPGGDFLAKICVEWESEVARGAEFGARVVMLRFGVVLAANGGALPHLTLPVKLGVGGRLGSGKQWISWLTLDEAVNLILFALTNPALTGPTNAVTPNPVRNVDFTRVLARVLHRPAIFPAPAFALRLAVGEMADALLLSSQRVIPAQLEKSGYRFLHADLEEALRSVL